MILRVKLLHQGRVRRHWTYIRLDHLAALGSDPGDEAKHVHLSLRVHHVQHGIDHNERTSPPDAGTARQTHDM